MKLTETQKKVIKHMKETKNLIYHTKHEPHEWLPYGFENVHLQGNTYRRIFFNMNVFRAMLRKELLKVSSKREFQVMNKYERIETYYSLSEKVLEL